MFPKSNTSFTGAVVRRMALTTVAAASPQNGPNGPNKSANAMAGTVPGEMFPRSKMSMRTVSSSTSSATRAPNSSGSAASPTWCEPAATSTAAVPSAPTYQGMRARRVVAAWWVGVDELIGRVRISSRSSRARASLSGPRRPGQARLGPG
jgi:hypothetical protein